MNPNIRFLLAMLLPVAAFAAPEMTPAEAKLRESLRATALQMRTMQTQMGTLEAGKAEAEQKNEALDTELETLKTTAASEKAAAEKTISELGAKSAGQANDIASLLRALEEWKAAQKKAADLAASKEAERAKLASLAADLKRQVADQRTKNLGMYNIGTEILARYEGFGLGTALSAREPFIGTMRVKLQNLVQDYSDKLADQKTKP